MMMFWTLSLSAVLLACGGGNTEKTADAQKPGTENADGAAANDVISPKYKNGINEQNAGDKKGKVRLRGTIAGANAGTVQDPLAEADRLYRRAECGVCHLPRGCRPAIQAARLVYAEIGRALESAGLDSVSRRAVVRRPRQLALLAMAGAAWWRPPGRPIDAGAASEPLPAIGFLVDAACSAELPARTFYQRTLRVLSMFERQAQRRAVQQEAPDAAWR